VDPTAKAEDIALEQTVELPAACVSSHVAKHAVGRVEAVRHEHGGVWQAEISFPTSVLDSGVAQLLNLLFGNVSLKTGVQVTDVLFPPSALTSWSGPRFGIAGLRGLCRVPEPRALLCSALKPLGTSARGLAELAHQFALGGIDIIKDDHSLANQAAAPFRDRVERCAEAVAAANAKSGGMSVYFPNVTSEPAALAEDLDFVRSVGCSGVLLSPLVLGMPTVQWVAATAGLAVLGHPALGGAYFAADHGIAPEVLLGTLFRLVGCDGVIYPNVGGRFAFTEGICRRINRRLREPFAEIAPSAPVPAGGIEVDRVSYWIEQYGHDTVFLIGSSLYRQPDLVEACRSLSRAVRT
jgi:ribulose-bisphosphate carboxylase large chain